MAARPRLAALKIESDVTEDQRSRIAAYGDKQMKTMRRSQILRWTCLTTTAVICACSLPSIDAQDFERYRPKPPTTKPLPAALPYVPQDAMSGSTDVIVDQLKGIMVVDHESRIQDPIAPFDGVRIDPAADLTIARESSFKDVVQPYIGTPVTIRNLNELARNIVWLYKSAGHPVVDVSMPPGQDITDGIVQIVVTESRIGDVRFRGNCHFSDELLCQQTWLRSGQRIYEPCLNEELLWFNQNPFRDVGVSLVPGTQAGTTDIVFEVNDEQPVRYYAGYEDSGVRSLGIERLAFGFNWGNAFGKDHQLNYQYLTDASLDGDIGVHSLSYTIPIFENRDSWTMFASWADMNADVGLPLNDDGRAWQFSGRYNHILCQTNCRLDQFHFGFDLKGTNTDVDFGGSTVLQNNVEIFNLMAGLSSVQQYDDGQTAYGLDAFLSPSHALGRNTDSHFNQLRPRAKASYLYARGFVERTYDVSLRSDVLMRLTGQVSSGRLLPTEQLGFGGFNTIRGYDMRTVNGDNGYIMNLEYRSKPIIGCCDDQPSSLTLLAFTDFGQQFVWSRDNATNEAGGEFLASVGVGCRYVIDPSCSVRFDYGLPLTDIGGGTRNNDNGRVHLGVVLAY